MRHTAAFRYQFPVTAYVTPLVFQNPPAPADIQEKILATDGEVPDYYRVVEAFAFHFDSRIFTGKLIFLFQVNHDFTTAFLYWKKSCKLPPFASLKLPPLSQLNCPLCFTQTAPLK